MDKAKFIVIEGQGFTGKTTQARLLVEKLNQSGIKAIETREPGGVEESEKIRRELLKRRAEGTISAEDEVKLFYKARKAFVEQLVNPNLENGVWVVSTRFSPSTFVYQGFEQGVNLGFIKKIDEETVGDLKPDLIILLDLPEEEVQKRLQVTGDREKHGYNELELDVIKKRREGYLRLAKENSDKNWVVLDASGSPGEVSRKIWDAIHA